MSTHNICFLWRNKKHMSGVQKLLQMTHFLQDNNQKLIIFLSLPLKYTQNISFQSFNPIIETIFILIFGYTLKKLVNC